MFAESESEELLNLLSQVRMVADEEARTDEVQQQQQEQQQQQQQDMQFQDNSCGAKSFPSPVSMTSAAATTATTTTLNSGSQAFTSTSAVGRYTASSTSAVDWTVRDNSNSHVRIGGGGGGARVEEQTSPFEAQSPDGRTPATGVKVLHRTTAAQRADGQDNSVEFFDADMIDAHHQPKQLFFMDAHKRAALQPQQQASPGSPLRLHTPSSLYPSGHAVAGIITASVVPRSTTPFSPTASVQRVHSGGGGAIHGLGSTAISAANSSPRPFTAPVGAEFSSTVLAGYRHAGNSEKAAETNAWQMDHLSRLAADLNRASGEGGDDGGGRDRYQDGQQMPAYGQREHGTRAASDAWTPATCTGTPLSMRASTMQSPLTQAQQHAQQTLRYPPPQQQVTPAKSQMYAVSSASSSPLCTGAATEGRMPTYTDPMAARVARSTTAGGSSSVTTPLSMGAVSAHRPQQQQQQQRGNVPQPLSAAEAAVANFFGGNSAAAETGGGASNSNNCGASQCGRRSGASGNEAAWRLNVEAELRELQRGGLGGDAARSGVSPLFSTTPTTVVSPLPPTSTTPYHQLLSQLRHSPQHGTAGHAARANTPPERRGFHAASTSAPQMRRTASEVSHVSCGDGADGGGGVGNGSRHATKFTRASLFPTPTEASGPTILQSNATSCHGSGGFRAPSQNWPHSSPSPAEAAALWERLSPYEKAAAAAATAPPSGSAAALFHTPDTVAKPVVLSSIAAHLQGEGMGSTDDERSFNPHLSLAQQQQQQQQQQRYPTPPSFTTAAVATPSTLQHAHHTGSRTRMGDIDFASAASVSLFPTPQSASTAPLPSPQQQQHGWVRQQQQQQQQQQHGQSPAYMQTAAPRSATSSSAQSRLTRPPQQQFQVPLPFMRDSPVEASNNNTNNSNNNNNNSPPSCSLRPSPQMRASDGSSPALRRYVITTPNARASVTGQHVTSAGTQQYGAGSAGRQSGGGGGGGGGGGSPMNPYGGGSDAPGGAGGRDARPRVQLSHMAATTAAALRSPLNAAAVPSVTNPAAAYNRPHTTPSYYASQGQSNAAGAAATSSVSPAAVCALIERIQAIAPTVLSGAADFEGVSSLAPLNGSHASNTNSNSSNNNSGSASVVPEVASASVIVAMSHDQHGCRLLQAVLDAECDGEDPDSEPEETRGSAKKACCDSPHNSNSNSNSSCSCSTAERRRQRRAEAFYHSTAVQVILRAIEPKLDAVMADGYGNFLLQKVFDMAPDAERQRLLRLPSLQHHLCEVACSPHGTFAVQRLVETVRNTEEERLVFVALERDMLRLLTNANGGHVLMKVMECIRRQYTALTSNAATTNEASLPCLAASVGEAGNGGGMATAAAAIGGSTTSPPLRTLLQERVDALFTTIQQNLLFVCQHKQGCCIVQKCLDFLNACCGLSPNTATASAAAQPSARSRRGADEEEATKGSVPTQQQASVDYFDRMAALLLPHAHDLSVHPFGNYVVTRLVDVCYARGSTATIDAVAAVMQGDLVRMCTNKFASNVVEHILRHCSERRIRAVCQALMSRNNAPGMSMTMLNATASIHPAVARLPLTTVVMDPYGNYVVQTLLTVAPVDELASATSLDGGMLPVLQLLLPLLSARNFGRKLETKTELAVLRVEQYQQQQQQQQQQQCRRPK